MSGERSSTDRLFHTAGPLTRKLRSPYALAAIGTRTRVETAIIVSDVTVRSREFERTNARNS